jgi:signal transduction histidine kinase
MRRRAAVLSPFLASDVAGGHAGFDATRLVPGEWGALVVGNDVILAATQDASVPYSSAQVEAFPIIKKATTAKVASMSDVIPSGASIIAAAPIFKPGGEQRQADVIGVIVVGRVRAPVALLQGIASRTSEVALADADAASSTEASVPISQVTQVLSDHIAVQTLGNGAGAWLAAVSPLPDSPTAHLVVAAPVTQVVNNVTDLVRAFLVAILAATLLAIIAGLWLSMRLARPMLDLADEAERVKTDFLANISHELRTPLTPIRGYAEILRSRHIPANDQNEYLDEIGQAAQRLERIVTLLLDVAAIEAGRFRIDPIDVDAPQLLTEAKERWGPRLRKHEIVVKAAKKLPSVLADPETVARVLDELIDNAVKFSPDGKIELGANREGDNVVLSVTDHGPGIDLKKVQEMRVAFTQAESGDTRRFGGLGLGLAFSEGVLSAHGSRLEISTEEGKGTACSFALPVAGSVTRMPATAAMRKRT